MSPGTDTAIAAYIYLPLAPLAMLLVYWHGRRAERRRQERRQAEEFNANLEAFMRGKQHG